MQAFTEHLLLQGLAANTIRVYRGNVERANLWLLADRGHGLDAATAADLADYAATLPVSNSSRGQLRSALKLWYEHVGAQGRLERAVRVPPQPELVCRALEDDEARAIVKVAVGWWPQGTAVLFGLYLALRRTEIARAEWDRLDGDWFTVTGKGDRTATLPVHPVLAGELAEAPRSGRWVFPGRFPDRSIAPATVWAWVHQVTEAAGVGPIQPHRLRHTALAVANDRTGNLRAVQTFARHTRPDTTAGYTRTRRATLRQVSDALDYL